ncbi:MAG: hypothetical protein JOZ05_25285 [Acetobacteraceae bacterium]|nr:hypothetical protein [Acetobacteraceae bacterium]
MWTFNSYTDFRNTYVLCTECQWSGRGSDTQVGVVLEDGLRAGYHCPKCAEQLAIAPWAHIHNLTQ